MSAAVAQLKEQPMSFDDMLTQTAKPKAKTKAKSKMPTLDTSDEIKQEVDRYLEAKRTNKVSKAEMDDAAEQIITFVRPHQDTEGYNGTHRHSYAIPGTNGNQVKYISKNQFSINADDEKQLQEILGTDFDDLIEKKFEVKLKPEVFTDANLKQELMDLVGQEFGKFFDTAVTLKVAEEFDRRVYATVAEKELPTLRTFARPYKPSLR